MGVGVVDVLVGDGVIGASISLWRHDGFWKV